MKKLNFRSKFFWEKQNITVTVNSTEDSKDAVKVKYTNYRRNKSTVWHVQLKL